MAATCQTPPHILKEVPLRHAFSSQARNLCCVLAVDPPGSAISAKGFTKSSTTVLRFSQMLRRAALSGPTRARNSARKARNSGVSNRKSVLPTVRNLFIFAWRISPNTQLRSGLSMVPFGLRPGPGLSRKSALFTRKFDCGPRNLSLVPLRPRRLCRAPGPQQRYALRITRIRLACPIGHRHRGRLSCC